MAPDSGRLRIRAMPIEVGAKAPVFSLMNQSERRTGLDQFAGKWLVLYFYPKDDTPG